VILFFKEFFSINGILLQMCGHGEGEEEEESGKSFTKFSTFFLSNFFFPSWNHGEILVIFLPFQKD
jgi:hypothetical protein